MANRVLLNEGGLKISKSGVNVLTATPSQLQFTSDYTQFGSYKNGQFSINYNSVSVLTTAVTYGETLPKAPGCSLYLVDGSNYWLLAPFTRNYLIYKQLGTNGGDPYGRTGRVIVNNNNIQWIVQNYGPWPGGVIASFSSVTVRYHLVTFGR